MQRSINKIQRGDTARRRRVSGKRKRKRARRRRKLLAAVLLLLIFVPVTAGILFYQFHPVFLKSNVVAQELSETFHPEENIRYVLGGTAGQVKTKGKVDISTAGDYPIEYIFRGQKQSVVVRVRDTKAPELTVRNYTTDLAEELKPEFFVKEVKDASEVSVKFEKEAVFTEAGTYDITVAAEDSSGNVTRRTAQVTLKKDETPPRIQGADDVSLLQGKTMDFMSGVTVQDDMDPDPVFKVDDRKVDLNAPGTYTVVYTAKDRSGNESRIERKIIVRGNEEFNQKIVYLTFDDGPSENTGRVLDILKTYNVKATFFVTGNNQKYDNLMKRAHDEGHAIGLHTYTHDYKKVYASAKAYFEDLNRISGLVEKVTGEKSYIIRFPGGSSNTVSTQYTKGLMTLLTKKVQEKGYQYFDWNCDSTDASGNNVPVNVLIKNATSCSSRHINILMHDTDAKDTTVKALPKIIEHYRDKGYTFKAITVDSYPAHHGVNN